MRKARKGERTKATASPKSKGFLSGFHTSTGSTATLHYTDHTDHGTKHPSNSKSIKLSISQLRLTWKCDTGTSVCVYLDRVEWCFKIFTKHVLSRSIPKYWAIRRARTLMQGWHKAVYFTLCKWFHTLYNSYIILQ